MRHWLCKQTPCVYVNTAELRTMFQLLYECDPIVSCRTVLRFFLNVVFGFVFFLYPDSTGTDPFTCRRWFFGNYNKYSYQTGRASSVFKAGLPGDLTPPWKISRKISPATCGNESAWPRAPKHQFLPTGPRGSPLPRYDSVLNKKKKKKPICQHMFPRSGWKSRTYIVIL